MNPRFLLSGFINHWETKPQVGERMNPGRSLHGLQDSLELSDGKGILKVENSSSCRRSCREDFVYRCNSRRRSTTSSHGYSLWLRLCQIKIACEAETLSCRGKGGGCPKGRMTVGELRSAGTGILGGATLRRVAMLRQVARIPKGSINRRLSVA